MAHNVLPSHRPHDQLRTEAPSQKKHTDKYVSAYVSSDNYVDMSFSNPVLQESADHYSVGIDELTVNLAQYARIQSGTNVLFRIRRLGWFNDKPDGTYVQPIDDLDEELAIHNGLGSAALASALEFKITRQYNTLSEIMERIAEICSALVTYIGDNGLTNPDAAAYDPNDANTFRRWNVVVPQADAEHNDALRIQLTAGGNIKFVGTKMFWSNFVIEIPESRYRYLLLGDSSKRYISVNPITGAEAPQYTNRAVIPFDGWGDVDAAVRATWGTHALAPRTFTGAMNLCNSLDRRVALEVGCSLPIKNSPMIDHGQEAPDFVLGRFPLQQTQTGDYYGAELMLHIPPLGATALQGPRDRICYHHLGPQQKIQMLRLRLWARVRTYNADQNKWDMKTIQMPAQGSDFWHIRLHFRRK